MRYFDGVLKTSPYVAGDHFSMADITVLCGPLFADAAGIAIPADLAVLAAWRSKVANRPGVKSRSGQSLVAEDRKRLGF